MVIFFGPAGSGKSVQGQILAARHGWRWLSAGQLLRDAHDPELIRQMHTGGLVDSNLVNDIMGRALQKAKDIDRVILDGYPREFIQAKWLVEAQPTHGRSIGLVVVLDVPKDELMKRLRLRGRADDTELAIEERLAIFKHEIEPILEYFTQQGIVVKHVNGTGSVGQVHDRIEAELAACSLV